MDCCSDASNTSKSAACCRRPACVVLSSVFVPVLGHWRDTDEREFGATRRHPVVAGLVAVNERDHVGGDGQSGSAKTLG
jgi:hypothetical protein